MNTINYYSKRLLVITRLKSEIDRLLMVAFIFNTTVLVGGIVSTDDFHFAWLEWNLFLAFVPYWISRALFSQLPGSLSNKIFWPAAIAWLLFVPNAFYILTDLFHLNEDIRDPNWYNLLIIFSFAWNGLLLGLLSVRQMEKLLINKFKSFNTRFYLYPIMLLNAFGIYLGRYLRFNSWDILSNPVGLYKAIYPLILHPVLNANIWAMVFCYTFLMTLLYNSMKNMSRLSW